MNGYIKLHRKLTEWGWYSDSAVKSVFLHILLTATFRNTTYKGHELKPGQAIIGRKRLAMDLGLSEQQVRTAIKKLESTGEISVFSTNKFSVVTVENWEFYQDDEVCEQPTINQQITNNQPTNNQQITNNQPHLKKVKNVKKVKKVRKDIYTSNEFQEVVDSYNRICQSLPKCITLSDKRKRSLKARFANGFRRDDFETIFRTAEKSDFLSGRNGKWKANFDWLINEANMIKVLEGNYDNRKERGEDANYTVESRKGKDTSGDYDYSKFFSD